MCEMQYIVLLVPKRVTILELNGCVQDISYVQDTNRLFRTSVMFRTSIVCSEHQLYVQNISCMFRTSVVCSGHHLYNVKAVHEF